MKTSKDKSYWLRSIPDGYQRLFYFTGHEHLLENLKKKRVKMSLFSACNDAFELGSFSLGERGLRKRHQQWKDMYDEKLGLICFSRNWRNSLMWGHYAEKGQGACLVLDLKNGLGTAVSYSRYRTKVDDNFDFPKWDDEELRFKKICARKSLDWTYEEEVRLIKPLDECTKDGDHHFLEFGDELKLAGVINGAFPEHGKKAILRAYGDGNGELRYFQCRPAFQSFDFVCQQNEERWKA